MEVVQRPAATTTPTSTAVRACATCVRAKARCVSGGAEFQGKCQRCYRLSKVCEPAVSKVKSEPKKRRAGDSSRISKVRVEKLEEKLDDLVSLLKSSKKNDPITISPTPTLITSANTASSTSPDAELPASGGSKLSPSSEAQADDWDERLHLGGPIRKRFAVTDDNMPPLAPPLLPGATTTPFQIEPLDLGGQDPDALLNIFRSEMSLNFPFVKIPDDVTAEKLRQDRPSLYTAIMAVTSRITALQTSIGREFSQQVAQRVYVNHERNLDILLGCLTYATWCPFHFFNIPVVTSLVSTAHTLIADLGLNRIAQKDEVTPFKSAVLTSCGVAFSPAARSIEDRRVALGSWYLTSLISNFFHRLDKPLWTPYLEDCLQILSETGHESCAVGLIKIQLVVERIILSPWHGSPTASANKVNCAPPKIYLKSVESQLEALKLELAPVSQSNVAIRLAMSNVYVLLYKIGLSKSAVLPTFTNNDFNRVEVLFKCVQSIKAFFDDHLSIPLEQYPCISVPMCAQMTGNLGILQLLSTFDHPEWDSSWLREKISFIGTVAQFEKNYAAIKRTLGFDLHTSEGLDIYSHTAAKIGWMRNYFENKANDAASREQQKLECIKTFFPQPEQAAVRPDPMLTDPIGEEMLDLLDEAWMRDIMIPWEFQDPT